MTTSTPMRERICIQCQQPFSYPIGTGTDRRLCSDFCRNRRRHQHMKSQPLCVVDGCRNHRGYSSGICNACYTRLQRTGTLERRQFKYRILSTNGYVIVRDKSHPLARSNGMVYEHRKVLFDAIGEGPHACHWCKREVAWVKGICVRGSLVPDHLDGDKANNAISNLVPSCNPCNAIRGLFIAWVMKHQDDPWLWRLFDAAHPLRQGKLAI